MLYCTSFPIFLRSIFSNICQKGRKLRKVSRCHFSESRKNSCNLILYHKNKEIKRKYFTKLLLHCYHSCMKLCYHFNENVLQTIYTWEMCNKLNLLLKLKIKEKTISILEDRLEVCNLQTECCICFQDKKSIVFLPCGHFICCLQCSSRIEKCPMCKTKIEEFKKVFL